MEPLTPEEIQALCKCGQTEGSKHAKLCFANYRSYHLESEDVPHGQISKSLFSGVIEIFRYGELRRREWFFCGRLHRYAGPAIEYCDRVNYLDRVCCWWYHGETIHPEDLFEKLTDEQRMEAVWNLDQWKNYSP